MEDLFCDILNMYDTKSSASNQQVCMSMVGTPDYMAPEIILKSGHNYRPVLLRAPQSNRTNTEIAMAVYCLPYRLWHCNRVLTLRAQC